MNKSTSHLTPHTSHRLLPSAFSFLLSPFSLLYGMLAALRRKAYRHPENFPVPTICVGNLRVGGTGKTPMVEYIANLLSQNHQIAILSRGYGRKTKGYIHAHETPHLSSEIIGDEPMQYATKFPNAEVAVCEKRKIGIQKLLQKNPKIEVVILDDAYQHLSVNYSLRILLTEFDHPFFEDYPLPSGRLRECRNASKYADIIVVTKCPENLTVEEKARFLKKLKPKQGQEVYFTRIGYKEEGEKEKGEWRKKAVEISPSNFEGVPEGRGSLYENNTLQNHPLPPPAEENPKSQISNPKSQILLITGIANPTPLVRYLETQYKNIHKLHFPDHHSFTKKDIAKIIHLKEKLGGENCTIITTEKDAMRLQSFENMPEFCTIPIETVFLENETGFKEKLLSLIINNHFN